MDLSDIGHGLLAVSSSQDTELWDFSGPGLVTLDTLARIGDITDDISHKDDEICVCITLTFYLSIKNVERIPGRRQLKII